MWGLPESRIFYGNGVNFAVLSSSISRSDEIDVNVLGLYPFKFESNASPPGR